jgi:hypothetical protein
MDGQQQPWGKPFESGLGNALMYPGDGSAPAEDVIQCRCVLTRELVAPLSGESVATAAQDGAQAGEGNAAGGEGGEDESAMEDNA